MKNKYSVNLIWIALLGIFVFCLFLWYVKVELRHTQVNYTEVYSKDGVWDLSGMDLDNTVVRLRGDVEHIPNEMLTPEEFATNEDKIKIGNPVDTNNSRTARLTLLMPDNGYYRFHIIGDYARLAYINGQYRGSIGVPSSEPDTFVPAYGEISVDARADDSEFEIVLQGANFVHRNGSHYTHILVGDTTAVTWFTGLQTAIEMFMVGMLFILFIIHLLFAAILQNKALNLCFSAMCLVFSLRLSLVGTKVFYDFFNTIPWVVAIKTEYVTVALSSALLAYIMSLQFRECTSKLLTNIFGAVFLAFSVFFIFADTVTNSYMILAVNVVYIVAIAYYATSIGIWIGQKIKKKEKIRTVEKITAISFLIFSYAAISDIFYYNGVALFDIHDSLTEISILIFAIFEALAIFDITMKMVREAKNAEREALDHAQNMESLNKMKTEFLQDMSHEMRTPLTVIATGMDYAYRQVGKENIPVKETKETINIIRDETARLGRMVGGMVDMATLAVTEIRAKTDFVRLLDGCVQAHRMLGGQNRNIISCDIPRNLPFVYVDKDNYVTVMNNLLTNAIRHTKDGEISVTARAQGSYITVEVSDTGEGIAPELLEDVTNRGVSSSGGMGLGLYICQTVVTAHGGEFEVESVKDEGTTVKFTVPVYAGQEEGHHI